MARLNVAVTGATGHLGMSAVRALVAAGHRVRALYRTPGKRTRLDGLGAEAVRIDVLDAASLAPAFDGMDAVLHLAAVISIDGDPDGRVMRTNVEGVRNVISACRAARVRKLVHVSSIHAFKIEHGPPHVDESHAPADESCFLYDQSKRQGELEVERAMRDGLEATILCPTGILGPDDWEPSRSGRMLLDVFKGRMPVLVAGGFDWVDARDVAAAACRVVGGSGGGERYILSGHWATFGDLAQLADTVTGRPRRHWTISVASARRALPLVSAIDRLLRRDPLMTRESLHIVASASPGCSHAKAARQLGYAPRPLADTLRETHAWFAANGFLKSA